MAKVPNAVEILHERYRQKKDRRTGNSKWRTFAKNKSSAVNEMGDRLVTTDMGRKVGAAVPFRGGRQLGPHLTQSGLGRGLLPYQVTC